MPAHRKDDQRHAEQFLHRAFTEREMKFCQSRTLSTQWYAAYWAAKEAVIKALQIRPEFKVKWTEMEIRRLGRERYSVAFRGALRDEIEKSRAGNISLTLAHCRSHATATVVIERRRAE